MGGVAHRAKDDLRRSFCDLMFFVLLKGMASAMPSEVGMFWGFSP